MELVNPRPKRGHKVPSRPLLCEGRPQRGIRARMEKAALSPTRDRALPQKGGVSVRVGDAEPSPNTSHLLPRPTVILPGGGGGR